MSNTELTIRHVKYPINNKKEAFLFNFIEGLGRASGWLIVAVLVVSAIKYMPSDEAAPNTPQASPAQIGDE